MSTRYRGGFLALVSSLAAGLLWFGPAAAQTPPPSNPPDLLEQTRRLNEVAAQKVEVEIRTAIDDAVRLTKSDPAAAAERLKKVIGQLDNDTVLKEDRRASWKRIAKLHLGAAEANASAARSGSSTDRQISASGRRADEQAQAAEDQRIRQTLATIQSLKAQGKYTEASRLADDLAGRYPNNPSAQAAGQASSTINRVADARSQRNDRERGFSGSTQGVENSAVAPAGDITYPANFGEISKRREKLGNQATAKEKAILKALDSVVSVDLKGVRFEEFIQEMERQLGQTIVVDKKALEEVNVSYDSPISVSLKRVSARTVLRKVFGELNLAYVVKNETLEVTNSMRAREMLTVRTYYVGDLVGAYDIRLPAIYNQLLMVQAATQLKDLIQSTIDPQSWQANGGPGTIVFDPRTFTLIVKQTAEIHYLIGGRR